MGCVHAKQLQDNEDESNSRVLDKELERFIEKKIPSVVLSKKFKIKVLEQLELFESNGKKNNRVMLYPKDHHSIFLTPFATVDEYMCVAVACVFHLHKTLAPGLFVKRFIHVTKLRVIFHKLFLLNRLGLLLLLCDVTQLIKEQLLLSWSYQEWKNYKLLIFTDNYPGCRITKPEIRQFTGLSDPEKVFVPSNYDPRDLETQCY